MTDDGPLYTKAELGRIQRELEIGSAAACETARKLGVRPDPRIVAARLK